MRAKAPPADVHQIIKELDLHAKNMGVTRAQICEHGHLAINTVYHAFSGKFQPSLDTISRIATTLGLRLVLEPMETTDES